MTTAEMVRAKARYEADKEVARRTAAAALVGAVKHEFYLSGWTGRVREAYREQWLGVDGGTGWDWEEIFRRHRDIDRLDLALWTPGDRLSALSLGLASGQSIAIRFLEGDPRQDCPLRGRRALIVLECAARYAQARGKRELRVQPVNEALETLYREVYGFSLETPKGQAHYYSKVV